MDAELPRIASCLQIPCLSLDAMPFPHRLLLLGAWPVSQTRRHGGAVTHASVHQEQVQGDRQSPLMYSRRKRNTKSARPEVSALEVRAAFVWPTACMHEIADSSTTREEIRLHGNDESAGI